MNISLFKNVSEVKNPEILDLIEYLRDTKEGVWYTIVTECRSIQDYDERKLFKKTMPTACLSGEFSYRADKNLVVHNSVLAMDLDNVENIDIVRTQLEKDKYVFSCFLSTGGGGFRALLKVDPLKHNEAFKGACQYFWNEYGIKCDSNSSISKPYIVSFDKDLYLSDDIDSVPVFKKYVKETVIKNIPVYIHNNDDFENVLKQIIGRNIDITGGSYDDWIKLGFGLAEQFGEAGREYFHLLSQPYAKYKRKQTDDQYKACLRQTGSGGKANIRSFYYLAKSHGINIVTERTKEVVRITRNSKRAGLSKNQIAVNLKEKAGIDGVDELIDKVYESNDKEGFEDDSESILHVLELFISSNYQIRFNELSGFFENQGVQIAPVAMNSIFIAAKKILPKLDYNLMIKLLKSDFVEVYNPLFEFFGSDGIPVILPATPEEQRGFKSHLIDKLAESIENEDQAFTRYFLRKWLVSIISSAHKIHSPLLLCLLGKQGTGKTEFFRRLLPAELQHYYAESKLDKEKDDELLMTENLVIMDDELGGKSKQDAMKLKNITSKQWFSLRRPYGDHNEKILRLAVLCGTSNYKSVYTDPTGNRRVIPIEVVNINKELYNSINKKDLFMEMFRLYKEGFDWRIVHSDLGLLNKDEDKYSIVVKERELLMRYFIPNDSCPNVERMSTTDVCVDIEIMTKQRVNPTILSREMEDMGFTRKTTRLGEKTPKLWCVEKINRFNVSPNPLQQPVPFEKKEDDKEELPF